MKTLEMARYGLLWFLPQVALAQEAGPRDEALATLAREAQQLESLIETPATRELLLAVKYLPAPEPATIYRADEGGYLAPAFTQTQYAELDEEERVGLTALSVDTALWYNTFYGSPLASLRAFDVAAGFGIDTFADKRVLDFGFGSIGQLSLLAAAGAQVVGVEVMPTLRALYDQPGVEGRVQGPGDRSGELHLVFGRWPAEESCVRAVGRQFDLIVSKNTIKRGYLNPPVEVNPAYLLDLGVEQEVFLDALLAALEPGGHVLFYNLGGKPAAPGEAYRPPTDILSPWSRETLTARGFEVRAIDVDDTEMAREFGYALGWEDSMDVEAGLFARYTLLRRPE